MTINPFKSILKHTPWYYRKRLPYILMGVLGMTVAVFLCVLYFVTGEGIVGIQIFLALQILCLIAFRKVLDLNKRFYEKTGQMAHEVSGV